MRIIAIDPGTSNTGIVYMDELRVLCVRTIHTKPSGQDQDALRMRAKSITAQLFEWMADKPHDAIVIEGFTSFGGQHQCAATFQTPYICGFLHHALADENIVIQTSTKVLNPKSRGNVSELKSLAERGYEVHPESGKCTNDHLRSALCHGIYYLKAKGLV